MSQLPPPYYNDDKNSFAYATVHKRWPKIIETAINDIQLTIDEETSNDIKESGLKIKNQLKQLLEDFKNDSKVREFNDIELKANPDLEHFNKSLKKLNQQKLVTWQTGPWLYLECYLYQYIHNFFILTESEYWSKFDIFERLKTKTFKQSETGVLELCKRYKSLNNQLSKIDQESLYLLFKEFIDISLWGNATDLSLLAGDISLDEIKSVQGEEVRKKNEEKIIVNDIKQAWDSITLIDDSKRIDIVLDNSGFELFADLILSLFLLDSGLTSKIILHFKEIPWFVSDSMIKDFYDLINQLKDSQFFPEIYKNDSESITLVFEKIENYVTGKQIIIESNPFWTLDYNYWYIPEFPELYNDLKNSNLVIFKGDLNYRKLTGDLQWPKTTTFKESIQQLAETDLPILSLRTCKADVVVGLPEGLNEQLIKTYEELGNEGKFWSSSGKWAVISYNKS
ncbi:HRT2 [Candida pseudojiufengensis]|uniref:HRT2 n=1 Tax=Candida pseudojiufengensis TaxID=497109 RepID=UPI0022246570|nr:HRT2 [Candida pseudojiufengensis]KAI5959370.1 HRT2 [Candida pseudojiufengensis]